MKRMQRFGIITALILAFCFSGYELFKISERYIEEGHIKENMTRFRPKTIEQIEEPDRAKQQELSSDAQRNTENPEILALQDNVNKDIAGWLHIPQTRIDYPFVKPEDNQIYLRKDLYGKNAAAGSIFMDYRCTANFENPNTILYGHNMKNNSMFGDLNLFEDEVFFEETQYGTVCLKDKTYILEFYACVIVRADDEILFNPAVGQDDEKEYYVKQRALNYREPNVQGNTVTLSTCSYVFTDARIVLLAKAIPMESAAV